MLLTVKPSRVTSGWRSARRASRAAWEESDSNSSESTRTVTISSTPARFAAVGERLRIACDHGQRHRAAELTGGGHELACDVTELSLQVLGDDQDPAHDSRALTISAMREATTAGVSPSGSAPSPRGGTNMRRTR